MNEKILVVDDEENIVLFLEMTLKKEAFEVIKAYSGEEAIEKVKENSPDLVLLDVMLPGIDGFEVCREIRKTTNVPIIMLTARDEDMDKIIGLEMGADDYVVKPFNPKEIVARIRSIFRRLSSLQKPIEERKIHIKNLVLDIFHRKAKIDDTPIDFSPKEFDLLIVLASNPDKVFTREDLLKEVWGVDYMDSRSVDVHIKYIREKLGKNLADSISTVWGRGYRFIDVSNRR